MTITMTRHDTVAPPPTYKYPTTRPNTQDLGLAQTEWYLDQFNLTATNASLLWEVGRCSLLPTLLHLTSLPPPTPSHAPTTP